MENPIKIDNLGVPLFLETTIFQISKLQYLLQGFLTVSWTNFSLESGCQLVSPSLFGATVLFLSQQKRPVLFRLLDEKTRKNASNKWPKYFWCPQMMI